MDSVIKRGIKNLEKSMIFILKVVLFFTLFVTFFCLFAIDHPQIIKMSRTAAITMSTFVVLGISMTAVYGGFAVGKRKSKDIISSLFIATFITDFVTYLQLSIMNANVRQTSVFSLSAIGLFVFVILIQTALIAGFTYLGNYIYFKINKPEKCLVICNDMSYAEEILPKIMKFQKQYKVTEVISYQDIDLKSKIRHNDSVFIFNVPNEERCQIIDYGYKHYKNIYFAPELHEVVVNNCKQVVVDDVLMLSSNIKGLSFEQRFIKRTIDVVLSSIGLILLSPIMLIIAISIKLYDKGPVFFKQQRATMNGKLFNVLKFRTMIVDADKIAYRPARDNDDRITPVGKILRKLRIDELPQLINILVGEMSIVGPRPERIEHVEKYTKDLPEFEYRLRAKAGLTGLAQIAGKYNTTPKDKLMLDLMYIEKYSVWQDIVLMFLTIKVFFKSDSTEGFVEDKVVEFIKHQSEKKTNKHSEHESK